jgi:hypothetical protein
MKKFAFLVLLFACMSSVFGSVDSTLFDTSYYSKEELPSRAGELVFEVFIHHVRHVTIKVDTIGAYLEDLTVGEALHLKNHPIDSLVKIVNTFREIVNVVRIPPTTRNGSRSSVFKWDAKISKHFPTPGLTTYESPKNSWAFFVTRYVALFLYSALFLLLFHTEKLERWKIVPYVVSVLLSGFLEGCVFGSLSVFLICAIGVCVFLVLSRDPPPFLWHSNLRVIWLLCICLRVLSSVFIHYDFLLDQALWYFLVLLILSLSTTGLAYKLYLKRVKS